MPDKRQCEVIEDMERCRNETAYEIEGLVDEADCRGTVLDVIYVCEKHRDAALAWNKSVHKTEFVFCYYGMYSIHSVIKV